MYVSFISNWKLCFTTTYSHHPYVCVNHLLFPFFLFSLFVFVFYSSSSRLIWMWLLAMKDWWWRKYSPLYTLGPLCCAPAHSQKRTARYRSKCSNSLPQRQLSSLNQLIQLCLLTAARWVTVNHAMDLSQPCLALPCHALPCFAYLNSSLSNIANRSSQSMRTLRLPCRTKSSRRSLYHVST